MISLDTYIQIEQLENDLFPIRLTKNNEVCLWSVCHPIDINEWNEITSKYKRYQNILYEDLILETLTKTYDKSKLQNYIKNKFGENIEFVEDYEYVNKGKLGNNRFYIQGKTKIMNSKDFKSCLDLFGFYDCKVYPIERQ